MATPKHTNIISIIFNAFGTRYPQMMRQWPLNCHITHRRDITQRIASVTSHALNEH
jgi:hypothetical protein